MEHEVHFSLVSLTAPLCFHVLGSPGVGGVCRDLVELGGDRVAMGDASVPDTTTRELGLDQPPTSLPSGLQLLASAANLALPPPPPSPLQHHSVSSALHPPTSCPLLAASLQPKPTPPDDVDAATAATTAAKDPDYWEKRRRNNEAAKRSREKRRLADMAMESRLRELTQQNEALKNQLEPATLPLPLIPSSVIQAAPRATTTATLGLPTLPPPTQQPLLPSLPLPPPTALLFPPPVSAPLPPINTSLAQSFPPSVFHNQPQFPAFPNFPFPPPSLSLLSPASLLSKSPSVNLFHHFNGFPLGALPSNSPGGVIVGGERSSAFEPPRKKMALGDAKASPDSSTPIEASIEASRQEPPLDGKGQLRHKLLERQRVKAEASPDLGKAVELSRAAGLSLQQCLSSLAVNFQQDGESTEASSSASSASGPELSPGSSGGKASPHHPHHPHHPPRSALANAASIRLSSLRSSLFSTHNSTHSRPSFREQKQRQRRCESEGDGLGALLRAATAE